jgi:hypothetical protein
MSYKKPALKQDCFIFYSSKWKNPLTRRINKYNLNIDSLKINSTELNILNILQNFVKEVFYQDLRKISHKNSSLKNTKKYIVFSAKICFSYFRKSFLPFFLVLGILIFFFVWLRFSSFGRDQLNSVWMSLLIVFVSSLALMLLVLSGVYLFFSLFWLQRNMNYDRISLQLVKSVRNKILLNSYIEKLCKYPKNNIQEIEKSIGYEIKEIQRELDSNLELAPLISALVFSAFFIYSGWSLQAINSTLLGVAGLLAVIGAFFRWLNRKNKKFQIDCLEQLVLLLQLAQDKLSSKEMPL